MAKLKRKETRAFLECQECKRRTYITRFKAKGGARLELKKYCPSCRTHAGHRSRRVD